MYKMPNITQVNQEISPNDDMNIGDASKWYLDAGQKALANIIKALNNPYSDGHQVEHILDLPSGLCNYDLIWCGSLFTHFDGARFNKLLKLFLDNLNEKGVLVFTTHGRIVAYLMKSQNSFLGLGIDASSRIISEYASNGFGYANYDDKYPVYGVSFSSPAWVMTQIESHYNVNVRTCYMIEGGWGHQDVYGLVKL